MEIRRHFEIDQINKLIFVKLFNEAAVLLDKYLSTVNGEFDSLAYFRRIELAMRLDDFDKVEATLQKKTSSITNPFLEIAFIFCKQQSGSLSLSESINSLQAFITEKGVYAQAYYAIGIAYDLQGNQERALFNYHESIKIDSSWYLSYLAMSQIYYQKSDEQQGDYYFFLFEKYSPFSLYGNFETHKELCFEFLEQKKYDEAICAIKTLSEWWMQNRGIVPYEIKLYEALMLSHISTQNQNLKEHAHQMERVHRFCEEAILDSKIDESGLYFIAKLLEEFSLFQLAFMVYKKIVTLTTNTPQLLKIIQKIGSQFINVGEFHLAKELFDEGFRQNPNNADIRFCRLVTNLKLSKVHVEDYLFSKERLRQIVEKQGDKIETLSILHNLTAMYNEDADVQKALGDVYLRLGNIQKSAVHYGKMFALDSDYLPSTLKYISFLLKFQDIETAFQILSNIKADSSYVLPAEKLELQWLKSNYFFRKNNFQESHEIVKNLLQNDPWNISYVVHEILCLSHIYFKERAFEVIDDPTSNEQNDPVCWADFEQKSKFIEESHHFDLVYARSKIMYLYQDGNHKSLQRMVQAAINYNAETGVRDFLKLINTNFDSPRIYFSLGLLFKELWQLETASMWFQQLASQKSLDVEITALAHFELAECYILLNKSIPKAIELLQIVLDINPEHHQKVLHLMAHAMIRQGSIRQAKALLDQSPDHGFYASYLKGLISYRNGSLLEAKKFWKPLISQRTQNVTEHHLKQDVMKYYFEEEAYLKAN